MESKNRISQKVVLLIISVCCTILIFRPPELLGMLVKNTTYNPFGKMLINNEIGRIMYLSVNMWNILILIVSIVQYKKKSKINLANCSTYIPTLLIVAVTFCSMVNRQTIIMLIIVILCYYINLKCESVYPSTIDFNGVFCFLVILIVIISCLTNWEYLRYIAVGMYVLETIIASIACLKERLSKLK